MDIRADGEGGIILSNVFNAIGIETESGTFSISQRDGGIEVVLDGKTVYESVHNSHLLGSLTFPLLRRLMTMYFTANPHLRQGYQDNVAMLLHDQFGIDNHNEAHNRAADAVLKLIFQSQEEV